MCTFLNDNVANMCGMCETPRGVVVPSSDSSTTSTVGSVAPTAAPSSTQT